MSPDERGEGLGAADLAPTNAWLGLTRVFHTAAATTVAPAM